MNQNVDQDKVSLVSPVQQPDAFQNEKPKDQFRQIMAMMYKNYLIKSRNKKGVIMELLFSVLFGYVIQLTTKGLKCSEDPCPPDEYQNLLIQKSIQVPMFVTFLLPNLTFVTSRFILQQVVEDKQTKMRETLRLMSLSRLAYALSYLIFQAIFALISGTIIGYFIFSEKDQIFAQNYTNNSIQFVMAVVLLLISVIPFSMALSTFFSDSKVAQYVGSLFMVFPTLIFLSVITMDGSDNTKKAMYGISWMPLFPAMSIFSKLATPQPDILPMRDLLLLKTDWINTEAMFILLALNIPLWFMIYLYLDSVMPNTYGVQKHPCFCLKKINRQRNSVYEDSYGEISNKIYNQDDPILIQSLTKKFGKFTAVNNLTMSIKEGEIFTILGHNGAGKTTAIFMLTGMLKTTSGRAVLYGNDVNSNIDLVQQNLGLCQQFDVLFEDLTVYEHLKIVCDIKNVQKNRMVALIQETLSTVMLTEHSTKKVKELSGGMKRKLSLAMAIVSKPKVIILDEPTSGLDVESRRQTWELIKKIKVGRSIIMSSQHLEEADELADRICIMTKGQLLQIDKPEEIKRQFGVGFKVLIEAIPAKISPEQFLQLKQTKIDPLILSQDKQRKNYAENSDSTDKLLIYQVPFSEVQNMSELLADLKQDIGQFCSIDVENNSLEDAYINVAQREEELLNDLQKYGVTNDPHLAKRKTSIQEHSKSISINHLTTDTNAQAALDLKRYKEQIPNPSFLKQALANFKRRLLCYIYQPKEVILNVQMVMFMLIEIIVISTIAKIITSQIGGDDSGIDTSKLLQSLWVSILPVVMLIAVMTSSSLYVITPVKDRQDKLRYLLNFAGISSHAYYFGIFLADMVLFTIPCSLIVTLAYAFQIEAFTNNAASILGTMITFGLGFIPFLYICSFLFKDVESAFKYVTLPLMMLYGLPYIFMIFLDDDQQNIVNRVFMIISPLSCLSKSLSQKFNSEENEDTDEFFVQNSTIIIYQMCQFVVYFTLVILIDYFAINSFKGKDLKEQTVDRLQLDEDKEVKDHQHMTKEVWENDAYMIKTKDIMKVYGNGVAAVNNNSFCVKNGQVLGLLGPNGAGKSSMFNVMTMDLKRSDGDVKLLGKDLDSINVQKDGSKMGMCPQFNTIWDQLTVDQSIRFIGEIKGLTSEQINFQKDMIKSTLDLEEYSDTKAQNLSGGNKRKLVCAMSLVACPSLEFLDEPTTGVDPVSRRSLFKMLKKLTDSSLVLTTHRMDEAESLCDNIAIMINGRFACYGSPSRLKSAYGQGYQIQMTHKVTPQQIQELIKQTFPLITYIDSVTKVESINNIDTDVFESNFQIKKQIDQVPGGLSGVFKYLCDLKFQSKSISDFSICRSSLETVFVQFAKHQIEQPDQNELQVIQ